MIKSQAAGRRSRIVMLSAGFMLSAVLLPKMCYSQPVSSVELINRAQQYDGQTVAYQGEVIGDVMARKDHVWINVNDGKNALGIWVHQRLAKDISFTGSYKSKGDVIEVTGIFQRSCVQHGGDLDIHAQTLRIVNPGRATAEGLNVGKQKVALILTGILLILWILTRLKIR
jgi:hypothetical protein